MNLNAVTRNYGTLTTEERFRLILAAGVRRDEAERDRLVRTGQRITLSMSDHAPYVYALHELANLIFIELMEEAVCYGDAFARTNDVCDMSGDDEEDDEEADRELEGDAAEQRADTNAYGESGKDASLDPACQRFIDLGLAAGFLLRTKAAGWKLFCERLNIPPFQLWEGLPGCDRLQLTLDMAEKVAFVPEGFLRWLNRVRPAGEPELSEVPLTIVGVADATERMFRERVTWWGGDKPH